MFETTLIGNIGRQAVTSQAGEKSVINFSVAVNESWLDANKVKQEKTTWIDCSLFRQSTSIVDYLKTGQTVWMRGKIGLRQWQSKGGEHQAGLSMIIDQLELIGSIEKK